MHLATRVHRDERVTTRHDQVQRRRVDALFLRKPVDERERRLQRGGHGRRRDFGIAELARVVKERQEEVKQQLAVCLSAHISPQKLGNRLGQPIAHRRERGDGARVREEPLTVAKGMRVFGRLRAHCRAAHVPYGDVGAHIRQRDGQIDRGSIVDRSTPQKNLAALVEADAPTKRLAGVGLDEQARFVRRDAREDVRPVCDEPEETCHGLTPVLSRCERRTRIGRGLRPLAFLFLKLVGKGKYLARFLSREPLVGSDGELDPKRQQDGDREAHGPRTKTHVSGVGVIGALRKPWSFLP